MDYYCANYYSYINCQNIVDRFGDRCDLCLFLKSGASLSRGMLPADRAGEPSHDDDGRAAAAAAATAEGAPGRKHHHGHHRSHGGHHHNHSHNHHRGRDGSGRPIRVDARYEK